MSGEGPGHFRFGPRRGPGTLERRNAQRLLKDNLPVEDLLPTRMPIYVNSMSSLFEASALSALGVLVLTGVLLSLFGPE